MAVKDVRLPEHDDKKGSSPKYEAPPRETMDEFWERRRKELEDRVKVMHLERDEERYQRGWTPKEEVSSSPLAKDEVPLGKLLLEMVNTEREARIAAESARTDAEAKRWQSEADHIKSVIDAFKEERAKPQEQQPDPLDLYRKYKGLISEAVAEIGKNLPDTVSRGLDGPTTVQLERLRFEHDERMEQFSYDRAITLEQMKQTHDIILEESRLKRLEFEAKLEQIKQQASSQQGAWADVVEGLGRAVAAVVAGTPEGQLGVARRVEAAAEPQLALYHCECGFDIPVPPEVEALHGEFECPKCGQRYRAGREAEVGHEDTSGGG